MSDEKFRTSNRIAEFKMGDTFDLEIDTSSGTFHAYKNPVSIDLDLPSGHFHAKISTPISEEDFGGIMSAIRAAMTSEWR